MRPGGKRWNNAVYVDCFPKVYFNNTNEFSALTQNRGETNGKRYDV